MKGIHGLLLCLVVLSWSVLPQKAFSIPSGAVTFTSPGFTWLSPQWTLGISYKSMIEFLEDPNSDYSEFRFSTLEEMINLSDYFINNPQPMPILDILDEKEHQDADTDSGIKFTNIKGFLIENIDDIYTYAIDFSLLMTFEQQQEEDTPYLLSYDKNNSYPSVGSWLVSTNSHPVPEPSTILLLGSGLLGLVWYGRKLKKG